MDAVATAADLGRRIKQARVHRRLDQAALAASAGLDRTALSKIETGSRSVSALELVRIAAGLSLTVPDLVFLPPEPVRAARVRPDAVDDASAHEAQRFGAEVELDRLLRDAEQLRELGRLPDAVATIAPPRWAGPGDADDLARQVRHALGLGEEPLGAIADVCAALGLWVSTAPIGIDGLTASPAAGFGAAVVDSEVEPGRRRATAAHELGHHLAGDSYSTDLSVAASRDERENLIDLFASALLLPLEVGRRRLHGLDAGTARDELVRICHEYRVSWSLGVRMAERASAPTPARPGEAPTRDEFLRVVGSSIPADLAPRTMAKAWVRAVVAAQDAGELSAARAREIGRSADLDR